MNMIHAIGPTSTTLAQQTNVSGRVKQDNWVPRDRVSLSPKAFAALEAMSDDLASKEFSYGAVGKGTSVYI
ncbi:hypothetical protein JYT28_01250 [Desulfobulbus sp. AH-315-M07]|nr:hypothetical protein [Desulfobulbus sp. AH-315-M07]